MVSGRDQQILHPCISNRQVLMVNVNHSPSTPELQLVWHMGGAHVHMQPQSNLQPFTQHLACGYVTTICFSVRYTQPSLIELGHLFETTLSGYRSSALNIAGYWRDFKDIETSIGDEDSYILDIMEGVTLLVTSNIRTSWFWQSASFRSQKWCKVLAAETSNKWIKSIKRIKNHGSEKSANDAYFAYEGVDRKGAKIKGNYSTQHGLSKGHITQTKGHN